MSIDCFLDRKFNKDTYQCAHFAADVFEHLTGRDVRGLFHGLFEPMETKKIPFDGFFKKLRRLDNPISPCIVLMMQKGVEPHIGIFYKNRILHLRESGAHNDPVNIATMGFNNVRYYKCL